MASRRFFCNPLNPHWYSMVYPGGKQPSPTTLEAYHRQTLSATGASHALSVRLTRPHGQVISHLITARDSLLQVWEVRERETEGKATATLHHILTRRLHGTVTSLSRVRTLASKLDGADRVLISFLDAKMSLMEWTPSVHELLPISLHTYEKLPQVVDGLTKLATDPASRLSVLLLPTNTGGDATLAILPFFQEEIDLESLGVDADAWGNDGLASLPYAPSHLLPLASLTSSHASFAGPSRSSTLNNATSVGGTLPVRNVIDMVFLPGFNEPTLALLYAPEPTWAGRLENASSNCLVSLVTLATGASKPGSSTSGATTAVVIATSPTLPHSSLAVYPCPPALGGTLIVTANGILHLEQSGKVIGTPANAWFGKEWFGSGGRTTGTTQAETSVREGLEGSRVVFVANDKAIVFCKSGSILELKLQTSGRSVSSMKLDKVARGTPASCVERIRGSVGRFGEQGYVFVGSEVGESALVSWEIGNAGTPALSLPPEVEEDGMHLDEDEDLYGTAAASLAIPAQQLPSSRLASTGRSLALVNCDTIESYGAIRSMAVGLVSDDSPLELVACTGAGITAGFTIFHRSLPPRKKRKIDLDSAATRGIWSLAVNTSEGVAPASESSDSVLVTSDGARTKMTSQLGGITSPDVEVDDATISMFGVSDGALIVRVTSTHVLLLAPDLVVVDSLAVDDSLDVLRSTVSSHYVLLVGKKGAQLVLVNSKGRKLERCALPDRFADFSSATLFSDSSNAVPLLASAPAAGVPAPPPDAQGAAEEAEDDLYATAPRRSLASDQDSDSARVILPTSEAGASPKQGGHGLAWQWLAVVDGRGALEILLLPSMKVVFSASALALFPDVLEDGANLDIPDSVDPDDVKIDRVVCVGIGATSVRPHLLVLLANGAFAAYEAFPSIYTTPSRRKTSLGVRFVKVLTRRLPMPIVRRGRKPVAEDAEPTPARREFVPFSNFAAHSGVFVTGEDPFWLVASDHGPVRLFDHGEKGVYSFSPIFFNAGDAQYVVQSKAGTSVASLPSEMCLDRELPYARTPRDRRYGALTFDIDSGLYVAGALFDTVFMNFDEDGQPVFSNDSPDLIQPYNYRSTLELLTPGSWQAIHGFEFRPNEFISTVKSVSLATQSTASGRKDFIAVGTTVYRAEDLAARGGIYVFEVVKIVPDPASPTHDHQLKLLFFEDTKSVVGNVCDLDGYLVMSMGQKLYVRALEQDEVLLAVGFLDVGVHVTSLQSMKNFLLIGDALQSVTLVVFQEDPYKLVLLGRDYRPARTSTANFLINDGKVSFIAGDVDGVLRLFEYDPTNIASHAGQRLLCRTEYNAGAEAVASLLYAKRVGADDPKQNGILYGGVDGSLYTLAPVREAVFRRLLLLQTQLARHVQHFGGLNPRGHRIVKNDMVSRAISKGVLDGELLAEFENLPLDRQLELTAQIGTDPDTVLLNLRNLQW